MTSSVIQLKCNCKNDPWGKQGSSSLAARYAAQTPGTGFQIDEDKEYSEMWMGTYPSLPATVLSSGEDLQKVLDANAERLIGNGVVKKFGTNLPFLPKILSIQKALPLQIHPDKELARTLHERDPEKFLDTNHKPEIAVALSRFETFVGWKPFQDIQSHFQGIDALRKRFTLDSETQLTPDNVRELVGRVLSADENVVEDTLNELMALPRDAFGKHAYIADLLPRLAGQYSKSDPGSLVALFAMNYLVLNLGDSLYVPPDGIHAYLFGDIVECMARSDNMLEVGFCPPAEKDDVGLFNQALTFASRSADEALLQSKPFDRAANGKTRIYAPPMSEFSMIATKLDAGESDVVQPIKGPSVMFVTSGEGQMGAEGENQHVKEGFVFFVGCGVEVKLDTKTSLEVYRAFCEV